MSYLIVRRNMIQDYEEILKCLRSKSVEDLARIRLETPSFLTGMGPSRDGILIPADFGTDLFISNNRKRAQSASYQVSYYPWIGQDLEPLSWTNFRVCSSIAMLRWNKALWLDVLSYVSSFNVSECFNSAHCSYATYSKVCFDIVPVAIYKF